MNVLIYSTDIDAEAYKDEMASVFPQITFWATADEASAMALIENADILATIRPADALIARAKKLKWVQLMIAGTDYLEALPAFQARKEIILTSSRGIHGPQVSELAILFMLALNRRFQKAVLNQQRRAWDRHAWEHCPATLMYQKKVAILGMGTIGQSLARKCKAFEMTVYGIGPNPKQLEHVDEFFLLPELHRVAAMVDYFVCTAPGTADNQKQLNAAFFAAMKPSAYFINVGRGEVVDEEDLVHALQKGQIAGAGLDTFQQEPLPADHPFWGLDNLLLTPHVGGMCDIYVQQAVGIFKENFRRYLAGERKDLLNFIPRK
jgi:D-2-hydroxyacid dehydrogenase (NADP+)